MANPNNAANIGPEGDVNNNVELHEIAAFNMGIGWHNVEQFYYYRNLFETVDMDHDGYISLDDLTVYLRNLRIASTEDELQRMIAGADLNGDGLVEFYEFVAMM